MYEAIGQESSQPAAADPAAVQALLKLLPACYGRAFDDCTREAKVPDKPPSPGCRQIVALRTQAADEVWNAAMAAMPFCPEPEPEAEEKSVWPFVAVGALGILAGIIAAKITS